MEISGSLGPSSDPSASISFGGLQTRETDDEVTEAEVYLYTRKLESITGKIEGLENMLPDREEYHHWAFVFNFVEDESWRMVEGFRSKEGKLYASYRKDRPANNATMRLVTTIRISPLKLRNLVYENPSNEKKYKVTQENCQEWIKNLAKSLDDCVDDACICNKLENFRTLKEVPLFEKIRVATRGISKASEAAVSKPKAKVKVTPEKE